MTPTQEKNSSRLLTSKVNIKHSSYLSSGEWDNDVISRCAVARRRVNNHAAIIAFGCGACSVVMVTNRFRRCALTTVQ